MGAHKIDRIAFLLGAGTSIPAGMPSTVEITARVLSGDEVYRHTDGAYYFRTPNRLMPNEHMPRILDFLRILKKRIDEYYNRTIEHDCNYEDLHYLANQIHHSERRSLNNPAVQPFVDEIRPHVQKILRKYDQVIVQDWSLSELAEETENYITCIVWHMLTREISTVTHPLRCIVGACTQHDQAKVDIFTLNHDTVIEHLLEESRIDFTDGFGEPIGDVRYLDPSLFDNPLTSVCLFKLHGSIDWFRSRRLEKNWVYSTIKIQPDAHPPHVKGLEGKPEVCESCPRMLIGTLNKDFRYVSGTYFLLQYYFYRLLEKTKYLVVSGFGFRDFGIKERILEWAESNADRKVIIINPDPEQLMSSLQRGTSYRFGELLEDGRLHTIAKGIEKVSWQEIVDRFSEP